VGQQLQLLSKWSAAPEALRHASAVTASAFTGAVELATQCADAFDEKDKDKDKAAATFLGTLVARLRYLAEGQSLAVVRPAEAGGGAPLLVLVHRCTAAAPGSEFVVALCTANADALQYHPSRADVAGSGGTQHAMPLLLRDVPAHRVCDGAWWYLLLLADRRFSTYPTVYDTLCPALNAKPLLANWAEVRHCLT
jgi:hypothetical protein